MRIQFALRNSKLNQTRRPAWRWPISFERGILQPFRPDTQQGSATHIW